MKPGKSFPPHTPAGLPLVYVLGDSISLHYGPHLEKALRGKYRYARKTEDDVAALNLDMPASPNGGDSRRVVAFLAALAARGDLHPDVLVVNCGLHDIRRALPGEEMQVDAESYRSNLRRIIELAAGMHSSLVWVLCTPVDDALHARLASQHRRFDADVNLFNRIAREEMTAAGAPVIDLNTFTRDLQPALNRADECAPGAGAPDPAVAGELLLQEETAAASGARRATPGGNPLFADHVHFVAPVQEAQGRYIADYLLSERWKQASGKNTALHDPYGIC